MYFSNTQGLDHQKVLTGFFKSNAAARHARAILTDFGYSKDAAEVIELKTCSRLVTGFGRYLLASFKDKALLGVGLGLAGIFAGFVAVASLYSNLHFHEIVALFALWFVLFSTGIAACGLIGASIAALVGPVVATELQEPITPAEQNVLISVTVRTPADAQDIMREWEQIGGKVV
jgi:hypothetical protein